MASWRSINRDPLFESQLVKLHPELRYCDDALAGVEWVLALNAEHFPLIPNTPLRAIKIGPFPDIPQCRIFFKIEDDVTCTLVAIEVIEGRIRKEDIPT